MSSSRYLAAYISSGDVISPEAASLTAATLAPEVSIFVEPGALGLVASGELPSLFIDEGSRTLFPGVATLSVATEQPSISIGEWGQPAAASAVATGSEPALGVTDHHVVLAGAGSLTAALHAPSLLVVEPTIISPSAGTLSIDGSATNAVQNELHSPVVATLTITGHQVTLQRLFASTPDPDALAITGAAPSLLESVASIMQPAAAALAITGQAPVVDLGAVPIPSATTLTASGAAPALRLDMVCSPGVGIVLTNWLWTADGTWTADGELTADGIVIQTAPTVLVSDHTIAQTGAGSTSVGTLAPTAAVTAGVWSEPSAGPIVINGQQPTVAQTTSQYPSPNPCTITVECVGPTPVVGTVVGVPVATVAITSGAPNAVEDTRLVISGEAPVIGAAGPGNMVMSVIRLYGALDGGRDVRLKWPAN